MSSLTERSQERRKRRMNLVLNMMKSLEEIEYRKLIGLLSLNHGFSRDCSRNYIRELVDCEFLIIDEGILKISQSLKKEKELSKTDIEKEKKKVEDRYGK